jgi:hypothetical protein
VGRQHRFEPSPSNIENGGKASPNVGQPLGKVVRYCAQKEIIGI